MGAKTESSGPIVAVVPYERDAGSLRSAVSACDGFRGLHGTDRVLIKPNIPWASPFSWKAPPYGFATAVYPTLYVECAGN